MLHRRKPGYQFLLVIIDLNAVYMLHAASPPDIGLSYFHNYTAHFAGTQLESGCGGVTALWARVARQGLVTLWCCRRLDGGKQASTGRLHLDLRVPRDSKKPDTRMGIWFFGGSPGTRTLDPRLKRALLYQLS